MRQLSRRAKPPLTAEGTNTLCSDNRRWHTHRCCGFPARRPTAAVARNAVAAERRVISDISNKPNLADDAPTGRQPALPKAVENNRSEEAGVECEAIIGVTG